METRVTKGARTTIPAEIRRRHRIQEGDRLAWLDDGDLIRVVLLPADAPAGLRGPGRGERLRRRLREARRRDRERGS